MAGNTGFDEGVGGFEFFDGGLDSFGRGGGDGYIGGRFDAGFCDGIADSRSSSDDQDMLSCKLVVLLSLGCHFWMLELFVTEKSG